MSDPLVPRDHRPGGWRASLPFELLQKAAYRVARTAYARGWQRSLPYRALSWVATRSVFRASPDLPARSIAGPIDGLLFQLPRAGGFDYLRGPVEPLTSEAVASYLRPGMTVVDVGANVGFLSTRFARLVGPSGRVVAFEPGPENLRYLRANTERNGLGVIEIQPLAAGAARGRATLFLRQEGSLHGLHAEAGERLQGQVEVEVAPLEEIVTEAVDLIKIDAEGSEMEVLAGMNGLLARSPSARLVLEWNGPALRKAEHDLLELPRRVVALGYAVWVIDEKGGQVVPLAEVMEGSRRDLIPYESAPNLYARPAGAPPQGRFEMGLDEPG